MNYGALNLAGQKIVFYGARYIDSVFVTPGVSLDFSISGLGVDKLYLSGNFVDHQFSQTSVSTVTISNGSGASLEHVVVSTAGAAAAGHARLARARHPGD